MGLTPLSPLTTAVLVVLLSTAVAYAVRAVTPSCEIEPLRCLLADLLHTGGALHPLEVLTLYGFAGWFGTVRGEWGERLRALAARNAVCQLVVFAVVVQLPTLLTGHMAYVDLGWPLGLCVLALVLLSSSVSVLHGPGLIGLALLAHALRMLLGSLVALYPYHGWTRDAARYEHAKTRWIARTRAPRLWWLKQQHETLAQCLANCVPLAAPLLLVAANPRHHSASSPHPVEVLGVACWIGSWVVENVADAQKRRFLREAREKGELDTAVLGYGAYAKYSLWRRSRHPNYFCEWMSWNALLLATTPSVLDLLRAQPVPAGAGGLLAVVGTSRLLYDCLVHWTGAAAAEARSVARRPDYRAYQERTRAFFPFEVPFVDHHREAGWPHE